MRGCCVVTGVTMAMLAGAAGAGAQTAPAAATAAPPGPQLRIDLSSLFGSPSVPPPSAHAAKKEGFTWDGYPSIRYGDTFRLDVRVLLAGNLVSKSPDDSGQGADFEWIRRKIGIEGSFLKYFEYQVEYGLDDGSGWRDVFLNVRPAAFAQVRAGRFKIPFGYERLTGPRNLDFVYRSLPSIALTPGRSVGVMFHGRAFKRLLGYEAGVFQDDGDQAPSLEPVAPLPGDTQETATSRSWAIRGTVAPLRRTSLPGGFNDLEIGGAYTSATVPEGRNHLHGKSVYGGNFFDRQYYTNGPRQRFGLEAIWPLGAGSFSTEYMVSREARDGLGVGDESQLDNDLPAIEGRGWYVSGTWVVTGERYGNRTNPKRPLFQGGFGALEVAARYEFLRFASAGGQTEPPSRSPRAANVAANADRAFTLGVNWYANRWAWIRFNAINERIENPDVGHVPVHPSLWTVVTQFVASF